MRSQSSRAYVNILLSGLCARYLGYQPQTTARGDSQVRNIASVEAVIPGGC